LSDGFDGTNEGAIVNIKDFAEWLHEMQAVTGGCVLEMRADGRSGIALELSWRQDGQAMGYAHHMSGVELRQMHSAVQKQVLAQIRHHVEKRMTTNAVVQAGGAQTLNQDEAES
jgi:hypothetical protein